MIDKFILIIFGIEYLGFGLLGLIDPLSAASLVGFSLNELISLSEIRANYSFFCFIGLLSFVSLFKRNLIPLTYLISIVKNKIKYFSTHIFIGCSYRSCIGCMIMSLY